jgi:hypothetical protein
MTRAISRRGHSLIGRQLQRFTRPSAIAAVVTFEQAIVLVPAPCARPGWAKVSVRQLRA